MLYEYDCDATQQPDATAYEALVKAGYKPMPNVTLVRVDGSRHFIMYDQPAKLDAALEGIYEVGDSPGRRRRWSGERSTE